jgi:hypothetical protein
MKVKRLREAIIQEPQHCPQDNKKNPVPYTIIKSMNETMFSRIWAKSDTKQLIDTGISGELFAGQTIESNLT